MIHFSADKLSAKLQKKLLIGGIIPRPVALILTQSQDGVINLAPFSYFNIVSYDPPVLSVAIQRDDSGNYKDTARHLRSKKQASVHIVSRSLLSGANEAAAPLGPRESELKRTNFTLRNSQNISIPSVAEALITYECELLEQVPIEKSGQKTADLFLLSVVSTSVSESVFDENKEYIIPRKLDPISRLAGNDYADLGDIWTTPRPTK